MSADPTKPAELDRFIKVMADHASEGVWGRDGMMLERAQLPISEFLAFRHLVWCKWYEYSSGKYEDRFQLKAFSEEGRRIARAFKAELPDWTIMYIDESAANFGAPKEEWFPEGVYEVEITLEDTRIVDEAPYELTILQPAETGLPMPIALRPNNDMDIFPGVMVYAVHAKHAHHWFRDTVIRMQPTPTLWSYDRKREENNPLMAWAKLNAAILDKYGNGRVDSMGLAGGLQKLPST